MTAAAPENTALTAPSPRDHRGHRSPLTSSNVRSTPAARQDADALRSRAVREQHHEQERSARTLAAVVALACIEAEAGRRPLRDLAAWLDLPVYDKVARRLDLLERTHADVRLSSAPRPVGARVHRVDAGRLEACATIKCDDRARAVAMRLERRLSRWKVTQIEIG